MAEPRSTLHFRPFAQKEAPALPTCIACGKLIPAPDFRAKRLPRWQRQGWVHNSCEAKSATVSVEIRRAQYIAQVESKRRAPMTWPAFLLGA